MVNNSSRAAGLTAAVRGARLARSVRVEFSAGVVTIWSIAARDSREAWTVRSVVALVERAVTRWPPVTTTAPGAGHLHRDPFPVTVEELLAAIHATAAAQPRTYPLIDFPERHQAQWVARTRLMNYPDIIVAEGSMGLFDGVPGPDGHTGASADIAALLGWPVVLVVDVSGQAQSAGAVALGCMLYDKRIRIAGVILNKVASERHRRLAAAGMEKIGLPVFGALPREASLILPERHLGLVQAGETEDLHQRLDALATDLRNAVGRFRA